MNELSRLSATAVLHRVRHVPIQLIRCSYSHFRILFVHELHFKTSPIHIFEIFTLYNSHVLSFALTFTHDSGIRIRTFLK